MTQVRRVGDLIWTERRPYLTGIIFVALSTLTSLAYPYVVRLIIDDAIGGGQIQRLNQLSLIMVGILLLEAGIERHVKLLKFRPWIGVRVWNALDSFLPVDVQSNLGSPNFGTFYNSEYPQIRIVMRFER